MERIAIPDPGGRRQATDRKVAAALKEMPLHRLREVRRLMQKQIAEGMHIDQSRVSKIARRTDVYAQLRFGAGRRARTGARFPDGTVKSRDFRTGNSSVP